MFTLSSCPQPAPAPSEDGAAPESICAWSGAPCDTTTGIQGRDEFIRAADALGEVGERVAMLTLDLERFTDLNEHFGLACGDCLLHQVAARCSGMARTLPGLCTVGRVGADEFAIAWLPAHAEDLATLPLRATQLHATVCGSYELGQRRPLAVDAQVGVATMAARSAQAAETLLHAAAARHEALPGSGHVHRYEEHEAERRLGRRLRKVLQERRMGVALQPKVDLRSGAITGFEALARWPEEAGEPVPPSEFIPKAERMGLIGDLGEGVLDRVLTWLQALPEAQRLPVAVNFSAPQFTRPDLGEHLLARVLGAGLTPALLELELTETVLLDDATAAESTLQRLRRLGLKLAIDDFGTGYSSLSYLCRFSVDRLKLDRSFIAQLCEDPRAKTLVRSVIAIAHELGLQCVAEGIETREQLDLLIELGCDEGQGYLLSRPLSPEAAREVALGHQPWQPLLAHPPIPRLHAIH